IVVVSDVVRAHRPVIVGVGLAIWDAVELLKCFTPTGVKDPNEQLILFWVIACWFGKWDPIVEVIRQAHTAAIGLHFLVALAVIAWRLGADTRQHAAPGIAGNDIRADFLFHRAEMMAVVQHARLYTVPFLAVNAHRLAAHVVIHTRRRHQVALVGRVNEHFARLAFAGELRDRGDASAVFLHAFFAVEPFVAMDGNLVFPDQLFKTLFGDVRLENPHVALHAVNSRRALPLISISLALLPLP